MADETPIVHEVEAAKNRVKSLVYHWMSIWDANTGNAAPLIDALSPEGFQINLVEEKETLETIAEVKSWFAKFPTLVKQDNHIVESIEITALDRDRWRAVTKIRGPGIAVNGQPFLVHSFHDWEVVDYGGAMPRISKMSIRLIQQA
ncbi:hypothetical protein [Shewanella sp. HL-SH2]|uniref:hypothetical protein n=1 Tax=Shewanella sp. HL-SH2 TaxID=3436238 RepID=UPI003EB9CE4B